MACTEFTIPDTLAAWPWPEALNPYYEEVKKESSTWARSFNAFSEKAQYAFDRCDFNLLACLAYPFATKKRARTGCDLMNLFFVIDEYSDVSTEEVVRQQKNIVMSALKNPHAPRPKGEWIGGEVARQFWALAIETASPQSQKRFIETFDEYLEAVVIQAAHRNDKHVPSLDEYISVRRETIGAKPSFALLELGLSLPDEVIAHPQMQRLTVAVIDMLCLGNDIVSYNLEQSRGDDDHNIITILKHHQCLDLHGAMQWVGNRHVELERIFFRAAASMPSWGPEIDSQVAEYVNGLGNWVRANDSWSFRSERYFGKAGLEILKRRTLALLPKKRAANVVEEEGFGPQLVDGSLL